MVRESIPQKSETEDKELENIDIGSDSGLSRRKVLAVTGAITSGFAIGTGQVAGDSGNSNRNSAGNGSQKDYPNPSAQDIVEWLPKAPPDYRIQYGDGPLQFGDLRLPDRSHPDGSPVAVFVHGGGWSSNWNMDHSDPFVEALTDAGVASWNIEYRRVGNEGGGWPGSFLDVARGLDYLHELADEYSLDLSRVVVSGHSAGGHFANWLAGRQNIPEDSPLYMPDPLPVSGAVSLAGGLDLEMVQNKASYPILELLGVETEEEAQPRYEQASPRHLLPLGVPQEVIVGSKDTDAFIEISETYAEAASEAGDDINFTFLEGANHFDQIHPCGPAWPIVAEAIFSLMDHSPSPGKVQNPDTCPLN